MKTGSWTYRYWLLLLACYPSASQGQARLSLHPDRKVILVGEPISIRIDIVAPVGLSLQVEDLGQNSHWVWLQGDTGLLNIEGSKETISKTWVLTSYDTGYWSLPRWQLKGQNSKLRSDTIGVKVVYTAEDLSQDYRDIKEVLVMPVPPSTPTRTRWLIAAILTIAIVLFFVYWRKKKGMIRSIVAATGSSQQDLSSAWDKVYEAFRKKEIDAVRYYEKADELVRASIQQQYHFDTLHATLSDIRYQLKLKEVTGKEQGLLMAFLEEAELVKFARCEPLEKALKQHYDALKVFFQSHSNR
ncbi:MAG: hypothetical protein RL732_1252 [Bacteroidota bacterium]